MKSLKACLTAACVTPAIRTLRNSAWISHVTEEARDGVGPDDGAHCRLFSLDLQAVLVDMEEGVVNQVLQGALREVFDPAQLLTDVSGSGNNW